MALDLKQVHDLKTMEAYFADERFLRPMKAGESPCLDLLQERVERWIAEQGQKKA